MTSEKRNNIKANNGAEGRKYLLDFILESAVKQALEEAEVNMMM